MSLTDVVALVAALTALIAGVGALIVSITNAGNAKRESRITAKKNEVEILRGLLCDLDTRIRVLTAENADLNAKYDEQEARNDELVRINTELALQVSSQKAQIEELITERDKLRERVDELELQLHGLQAIAGSPLR